MRTKTLVAGCFLGALSVCLFQPSGNAADDDLTSSDLQQDEIEEIVVTGSRIKRRDFITPSPLTTIDRDDIGFAGQATIEETLNQMPQVSPSFGRASNNPGTGTAAIDLRGLGPGRTLTLLNGRRVGGTFTGSAVDLNNIPQFLIERVEIITGGTSAVYGSDAIAGVVNFITRDDYKGFGVEASMSMAEPGDAETYDINVAYGLDFADGRGNVTLFGNYCDRKPLLAGDREFTATPYWDDWEGNLVESGSSRVPAGIIYWPYADLGSGPVEVTFNPDGTPREFSWDDDLYNYAPVNYLQVPLERHSFGLMAMFDLSDRVQAYLETTFSRNEPELNLAPVPTTLRWDQSRQPGADAGGPPGVYRLLRLRHEPGMRDIGHTTARIGPRIQDSRQKQRVSWPVSGASCATTGNMTPGLCTVIRQAEPASECHHDREFSKDCLSIPSLTSASTPVAAAYH